MKCRILVFLFLQISLFSFAQDSLQTPSLDSNLIVADSLNNDSLNLVEPEPAPTVETLDTTGISQLSIQFVLDTLHLEVDRKDAFYAKLQIGDQEKVLKFENGKYAYPYTMSYKGELVKIHSTYQQGESEHKYTSLFHISKQKDQSVRSVNIPLWWSIVPPLVAILLALIFRQVLLSLFMGILSGAWIVNGMQLNFYGLMKSFFTVLDNYILGALNSSSHLSVIIFSLMIGGVVALISRNGGMAGIVLKLSPLAKGPKSTQFVAWLLGVAIFFDDYANTLIVGNTIRPVTDKYRISREKLAYIVDSTAAPIAAIAFITTWIGAELGYIGDEIPKLSGLDNPPSPYSVFLSSLNYSFYSIFTLFFILIIIFTGRDFGAMFKAEQRARQTGKIFNKKQEDNAEDDLEELEPKEGAPLRWINGLLPILVVVFGTLLGLIDTGMDSCFTELSEEKGIHVEHNGWGETWSKMHYLNSNEKEVSQSIAKLNPQEVLAKAKEHKELGISVPDNYTSLSNNDAQQLIRSLNPYQIWEAYGNIGLVNPDGLRKTGLLIGKSDSYTALLWASISAIFIALIMTISQRIMKLEEAVNTVVGGFKTMMPALLILILAWSLATTTEELSTAEFLTSVLGDSLSPYMMPVVIFILAAVIAFSTGSSWSTMAILYPIAIPMTWTIAMNYGLNPEEALPILYNVIAVVLSASVLGDHCSPISDTTILSSLASNCDHIDHVRTQLPYALLVGSVSLTMTYVSTAFGIPFIINLVVGLAVLFAFVMLVGKRTDTYIPSANNSTETADEAE
ncbi:MAG: Na+/H+ antiporter NhaC family protein [Saprospiraceae bacterium]|nr:Na+/H+ antiporter NhaC family protein [Saprospiraceae bacterium]